MIKYRWLLLLFVTLTLSGCAVNYKAQLATLAKCEYDIQSVDQVKILGKSIDAFQTNEGVSLSSLPTVAFALLRQDLPMEAQINLKIKNPTGKKSNINEFKYIVEIGGKPLFEGAVAENINLGTGESAVIPLTFKANIFGVAKEKGFDRILGDIFSRKSDALIALKIKPSVKVGNKNYFYPGYITVDKDLGKGIIKELEKRQ